MTAAAPESIGAFTDSQKQLIQAFMTEHDVPGVAIAVNQAGKTIAAGGFGVANVATGAAPTAATIWPIASVTKSFTAVAAMQCVECGLLDLDVPVQDYLPDLLVSDPETTRRLTMRRLLSHTSGLGRTGHQDRTREEALNPFPTRKLLVDALHTVVPQAPVGRCFSYSNESFVIAGRVIEILRDKPLEACFEDEIFSPLGMSRTVARFKDWREASDRAFLYAGEGIGPYGSGERHGNYEVVNLVGDYQTFLSTGGIASTAHDLASYQLASMARLDSKLGLTGAALNHMQSAQHGFGDSGWAYGLGYWVMPLGAGCVVGHSGGLPGVSTYSLMIPGEGSGVVVLSNRSDVKAMVLAERLAGDLRGPLWRVRTSDPLPVRSAWGKPDFTDLEPYTGAYRFRRGPAKVSAGSTGVIVSTPSRYDGPVVTLETRRVGRDRFVCLNDGHIVDFLRDGNGWINGFLNSGYRYEREG